MFAYTLTCKDTGVVEISKGVTVDEFYYKGKRMYGLGDIPEDDQLSFFRILKPHQKIMHQIQVITNKKKRVVCGRPEFDGISTDTDKVLIHLVPETAHIVFTTTHVNTEEDVKLSRILFLPRNVTGIVGFTNIETRMSFRCRVINNTDLLSAETVVDTYVPPAVRTG